MISVVSPGLGATVRPPSQRPNRSRGAPRLALYWLVVSVVELLVLSACSGGFGGPATVAVPNVEGMTQAAATTAITGAGLVLGTVTTVSSSTVPAGSVISESPAAATPVEAGTTVNLTVSSGAQVPNVVGLTQAAATTAITGAGLVLGSVAMASSVDRARRQRHQSEPGGRYQCGARLDGEFDRQQWGSNGAGRSRANAGRRDDCDHRRWPQLGRGHYSVERDGRFGARDFGESCCGYYRDIRLWREFGRLQRSPDSSCAECGGNDAGLCHEHDYRSGAYSGRSHFAIECDGGVGPGDFRKPNCGYKRNFGFCSEFGCLEWSCNGVGAERGWINPAGGDERDHRRRPCARHRDDGE